MLSGAKKRGGRYEREFTVSDGSTALPITGWVFWFTVKAVKDLDEAGDDSAVLQVTSASGHFTIEDEPNGVAKLTLEVTDTTDLPYGSYVYDIQGKDAAGKIWNPIVEGACVIGRNVTRSTTQ